MLKTVSNKLLSVKLDANNQYKLLKVCDRFSTNVLPNAKPVLCDAESSYSLFKPCRALKLD